MLQEDKDSKQTIRKRGKGKGKKKVFKCEVDMDNDVQPDSNDIQSLKDVRAEHLFNT